MKKATKIWLIIASSLVLIGCLIFGSVMSLLNWDFAKLQTSKYETNKYELTENFSNISINTDTADITFSLSHNEKCKVECFENKKAKYTVGIKEDTLVINEINEKSWYDYIGINFGSPKITVYLPKAEYASLFIKESTGDIKIPKGFNFEGVDISLSTGDVNCLASVSERIKIKTSTGHIHLENATPKTLELSVSTGKTSLKDIKCESLTSKGDTGDIYLQNVIASEKLSINRSTGDIKFDGSDAAEIFIETDTGDVSGSLLTSKVFITDTDTGRVNVPKTVTGGKCEITTDTGDITLKIK